MNTSSVLGLIGLVIVGIIIADLVASPNTPGVLGAVNSIFSTAVSGLLGSPPPQPKPPAKPVNQRK